MFGERWVSFVLALGKGNSGIPDERERIPLSFDVNAKTINYRH